MALEIGGRIVIKTGHRSGELRKGSKIVGWFKLFGLYSPNFKNRITYGLAVISKLIYGYGKFKFYWKNLIILKFRSNKRSRASVCSRRRAKPRCSRTTRNRRATRIRKPAPRRVRTRLGRSPLRNPRPGPCRVPPTRNPSRVHPRAEQRLRASRTCVAAVPSRAAPVCAASRADLQPPSRAGPCPFSSRAAKPNLGRLGPSNCCSVGFSLGLKGVSATLILGLGLIVVFNHLGSCCLGSTPSLTFRTRQPNLQHVVVMTRTVMVVRRVSRWRV
uniref:Uncharacterized protein n=1 Tax=Cucumis melo TaxID=3656 RepID=A0A9I9EDL0_CUCME